VLLLVILIILIFYFTIMVRFNVLSDELVLGILLIQKVYCSLVSLYESFTEWI